ncbi:unnamed protein product [Rotaria magnacalcarata]|uniref:Uncharacterized protein n=1 Tax=Rotaria magnacalcarata TaxID=392030 RepID=A0A816RYC2_9BILA|nr:unnamed protein product [Rotaria magnacalcarata]CAF4144252.1 unnamed protein product [Rotaria magnacalcarata]
MLQAAPNLDHLQITFSCLMTSLNHIFTCELLQKRIVILETTGFHEVDFIQLEIIAQTFIHLHNFNLSLENSTSLVKSIILKVLSFWRHTNIRGVYIRGLLTKEVSNDLRQWLVDHSHLGQDDPFIITYTNNWIFMWLHELLVPKLAFIYQAIIIIHKKKQSVGVSVSALFTSTYTVKQSVE